MIDLAERGMLPDWLIRLGIRRLLARRLRDIDHVTPESHAQQTADLIESLRRGPITTDIISANEQHYEVPADFFRSVLGTRLKYSCCHFPDGVANLDEAEERMLDLVCQRAEVGDGMHILDLGCGWGSLTLWLASRYPAATITALSNSHAQRQYIERQCRDLNLHNVRVVTGDVGQTEQLASAHGRPFDRILSVEMFEHVRNHDLLMRRLSRWLAPDGKLFVHIFCHRDTTYLFEDDGPTNWMTREFFSGGLMPADDLLLRYQEDFSIDQQWRVSGLHYARTCDEWLQRLDDNILRAELALTEGGGVVKPSVMLQRWRIFFMACAELFGYRGGNEWYISHYLFSNRRLTSTASTPATGIVLGAPVNLPR
jgi:cyclopropane-fatty-acyl-phospholipid synthase